MACPPAHESQHHRVFVWAGVYSWSIESRPRILVALFCGGLLYRLTQTIFKVPIEAYENDAYRRVAKGFRNPRRVRDALLRISFLTLSLVLCYPILFVYINLHRARRPPELLPDRPDDGRVVPVGLRSASPVPGDRDAVAPGIRSRPRSSASNCEELRRGWALNPIAPRRPEEQLERELRFHLDH